MREYTKKSKNQSRTLDSNPKASRQAPFDVVLQRYKEQHIPGGKAVVQRQGEIESGTGIAPYGAALPEALNFTRDRRRTRTNGALLNHYMVVRNGTQYQFPIRATHNPYTGARNSRALRPEPFGGNQDWNDYNTHISRERNRDVKLRTSRNRTLTKEYREESGAELNVTNNQIDKSIFYDTQNQVWNAKGTVSIVSNPGAPAPAVNPRLRVREANNAQKEMAGTIVIDTGNITDPEMDIATITETIKQRIIAKQKEFILDHYPREATAIPGVGEETSRIDRYTYNVGIEDFDDESEILVMLINLIAQQVAQRNADRPDA